MHENSRKTNITEESFPIFPSGLINRNVREREREREVGRRGGEEEEGR